MQEARANKAADKLKAMVSNTATVIRQQQQQEETTSSDTHLSQGPMALQQEVPIRELVPGDIIALSAGDMVPADCRLLSAKDLFVAQAAMTGESMPVEKYDHLTNAQTLNPLEVSNIVFMGTNVVSGTARAIVLSLSLIHISEPTRH